MGSEFKPGDVVHLMSHGPFMTVEKVTSEGEVKVVWFEKYNDTFMKLPYRESFPAACIVKATAERKVLTDAG